MLFEAGKKVRKKWREARVSEEGNFFVTKLWPSPNIDIDTNTYKGPRNTFVSDPQKLPSSHWYQHFDPCLTLKLVLTLTMTQTQALPETHFDADTEANILATTDPKSVGGVT